MAQQTLVVDASVGVKWFTAAGEEHISLARQLLLEHARGTLRLVVPELFYHEIANALIHQPKLHIDRVVEAVSTLWELGLAPFAMNAERLRAAVKVAREAGVSEYDACYAVAAIQNRCPLVTANPKHQASSLGCEVTPLSEWRARH